MYYPSSENKGADQLRGYREAELRLCFRLCRLLVFPWGGSYIVVYINFAMMMSNVSEVFLVEQNLFINCICISFSDSRGHFGTYPRGFDSGTHSADVEGK